MKRFIWAWSFEGQAVVLNQADSLYEILETILEDYQENEFIDKLKFKETKTAFKISFKNMDCEKQSFEVNKDIFSVLEWLKEYHCDEDNSKDYFFDIMDTQEEDTDDDDEFGAINREGIIEIENELNNILKA